MAYILLDINKAQQQETPRPVGMMYVPEEPPQPEPPQPKTNAVAVSQEHSNATTTSNKGNKKSIIAIALISFAIGFIIGKKGGKQ